MAGGLWYVLRHTFSQDPDGSLKKMITKDTTRRWTYPPAKPVCTYHLGVAIAPSANGVRDEVAPCTRPVAYVLWGADPHVPLATACTEHLEAIRERLEARYPGVEVEPFHDREPATT